MRVRCEQCGRSLEAPDAGAGQVAICPGCGRPVKIPGRLERPAKQDVAERDFAEAARREMAKSIRVICGSCGKGLKLPARRAGRKIRCPACGARIRIPFPEKPEKEEVRGLGRRRDRAPEQAAGLERPLEEIKPQPDEQIAPLAPAKRRATVWIVAGLVLIAALAGGLWIGLVFWPSRGAEPSPIDNMRDGAIAPTPKPRPAYRDVEAPADEATGSGSFRLLRVRANVFAVDGYRPAAINKIFWKVNISIRAGEYSPLFSTEDESFQLRIHERMFTPSGAAPSPAKLAISPKHVSFELAPGKARTIELLFEVPVTARAGELIVAELGRQKVGPVDELAGVNASDIAGAYVEIEPRNLKPLLVNPILAAIQAAVGHGLVITRRDDQLVLTIPQASVRGTLQPDGKNYEVALELGDNAMVCKLRRIRGGDGLILYLTDKPFGQLTYTRK